LNNQHHVRCVTWSGLYVDTGIHYIYAMFNTVHRLCRTVTGRPVLRMEASL